MDVKVVIDKNVFISALLFGGRPREIVELARSGIILNAASSFITDEIKGVLIAKFLWEPPMAEAVADGIAEFSEEVAPKNRVTIIGDCEADNRIIECALESSARFIISGDKHLLGPGAFQGNETPRSKLRGIIRIEIMRSSDFLELIRKR